MSVELLLQLLLLECADERWRFIVVVVEVVVVVVVMMPPRLAGCHIE